MTERDWATLREKTTIPWETFTRDEFVEFYWQVVAPILEEEGEDSETLPSAKIINECGFARYREAIRRHSDHSLNEFLIEEAGVTKEASPHEFNWPIDDPETKAKLDEFIQDIRKRDSTKQKESTIRRIAMNIYSFLQEWKAAHDNSEIIDTLKHADDDEAYSLVLAVYDRLNERVSSENTKCRYEKDHEMWFEFLTNPEQPLDYNPIPDVAKRFRWSRTYTDAKDRPALNGDQVRKLWRATETLEEKMIVIAACAWGLRTGEIASLHVSQLVLDPDSDDDYPSPVVEFGIRKNGPSNVNIIYGKEIAKKRIKQLQEEYGEDWNGYLFPSSDRRTDHLLGSAILLHRFQPVCRRAGLTIEGSVPHLKHARRFWYQKYVDGINQFHELVTVAADDQGSKDPEVVIRDYVGELDRVRFARNWMQMQLDEAFADTSLTKERMAIDKSVLENLMQLLKEYLPRDPARLSDDEEGGGPDHGLIAATVLLHIGFALFLLI